MMLTIRCPWC